MSKEKEVKKWLRHNGVSMSDMLKICSMLQEKNISIPNIKMFSIDTKSSFNDFKKWFETEPYSPEEGGFRKKMINSDDNIEIIIPATEEEKQILIKAVEEKYGKTYCEETKDWVDVNESIHDQYLKGRLIFKESNVESDNIKGERIIKSPKYDLSPDDYTQMLKEYLIEDKTRLNQIIEANKDVIEILVKVGVLQDPTNPSDVYSYNVGKSDYARKSPIQPWMMWQLWHWLTPWDCDIIKRLYRDKDGTSRIEDYNKIIHICKERIRQLENEEKDN